MKKLLYITCSVFALFGTVEPASADPISAAIAATLSTAVSAGGISQLTFMGLSGFFGSGIGAFVAQTAVRAALGYALNALASKPNAISRGYSTNVNQVGTSLPHQIIYGETRVGGAVFYQTLTSTATKNDRLHRCIAFAGHEIDSYQAIYLNDEEVTLDVDGNVTAPSQYVGLVRIKQHLGTADQGADTDLAAEAPEWGTDMRARGIAYLYVRFEDAAEFPNSVPNVSALIRGKKIEDTRTSTTAWSNNPAMIIRDYLLSDYGLEESSANINDDLFEAAADVCDETVVSASRYTCNGAFLLDASPEEIIRQLLSSMGGIFWNYGGQWAVQAAEYQTPTLTLTEDDLRGELQIATRHSRRDNFNTVVGQYKGSATDYQPDNYQEVTSSRFLLEDNSIRTASELNLIFTDTEVMAQRIARTYLRRNRKQVTVSGAFGLSALDLKIGDNVMLTIDHLSWTQKVFEVVDWRMGMQDLDIQIYMILREMTDEVFNGVIETLTDESENILTDESGDNLEAIVA